MGCRIFLTLLALWIACPVPASAEHSDLIGRWFYYKKIYGGTEMPEPPEATLRLFFEFHDDGTNRLYWWQEGLDTYCERKGRWKLVGNILHDQVIWVNPRNSYGCDRDPDMQLGRKTASPVSFSGEGDFQLHMTLGDQSLIYVWKKITDTNP